MARNEIHEGDTFVLANCTVKNGVGQSGREWLLIMPKDENGKTVCKVFAINAEAAKRFTGTVKVEKIVSAKISVQKDKQNPDKWYHDLSVDVVLSGTNDNEHAENKAASEFEAFFQSAPDTFEDIFK